MDERPFICQVTCIHAEKKNPIKQTCGKKTSCFQYYACCSMIGDVAHMQQRSSTEQI